ncbi:myelin protein zero-like protein 1 [Candoia aspera]|uniref:myelin protein zero-like protein 1 n=1 Tax=Candoia aspera TaxID=51853 RepID=UPI002FD8040A
MAAILMAAATAASGRPGKRETGTVRAPALWLLLVILPLGQSVEVSTPSELFVEAGTDAKLACTFTSSEEISPATSVTWSFLPKGSALLPKPFFYFSDGKAYNGNNAPFSGKSGWDGNFDEKDASIKISNMQPAYNGTYFCDVKNPPDIVTEPGEIEVKVWKKERTPVHERVEAIPEEADRGPENTTASTRTSGGISFNRASPWLLVFSFCCIVASFANSLFLK